MSQDDPNTFSRDPKRSASARTTPCPICKSPVPQDDPRARHYPFCSDRCKLIDLARWLDGKYQIPVEEEDESDPPRADPDR
jgi:endogenous inhibitor of DNA gyrase (YacG/DUF329 family)